MEIGRWGFKKITHISDRCREFQTFLADVLEGERGLLATPLSQASIEAPFLVSDDFSLLQKSSVSRDSNPAIAVFRMLAPSFEVGFLVRQARLLSTAPQTRWSPAANQPEEMLLRGMFIFGKVFIPPEGQAPKINLDLPHFAKDRVYRGRVSAVLKAFQVDSLKGLQTASAFAFVPMPGVTLILICNRPPPWQVLAMEQAFLAVQERLQKGSA